MNAPRYTLVAADGRWVTATNGKPWLTDNPNLSYTWDDPAAAAAAARQFEQMTGTPVTPQLAVRGAKANPPRFTADDLAGERERIAWQRQQGMTTRLELKPDHDGGWTVMEVFLDQGYPVDGTPLAFFNNRKDAWAHLKQLQMLNQQARGKSRSNPPAGAGKYRLHYREPGVRPGTSRNVIRPVDSVPAAIAWLNDPANAGQIAPCVPTVMTPGNQWQQPEVVAILTNTEGP